MVNTHHENTCCYPKRLGYCEDMKTTTKTVTVKTPEDFRALSYYTLCRLQDATHIDPIRGLPVYIAHGEFKGELTVDDLGNFISFN